MRWLFVGECCKSLHVAENVDISCAQKITFLGDSQHKRNNNGTKCLFNHLKSTYNQFLSNISLETFLSVIDETPHEKHFLSGESKPSSGMALGMSGLTMAGYGYKPTCCQIGRKYWLSFKPMKYKTLGMERKLTTMSFKVVPRNILLIMWV